MLSICCNNLSSKLSELFSSYLKESSKLVYGRSSYGNWWDDEYDDYSDWWDSYYECYGTSSKNYGISHSCHNDDDDYYPSYRQKSFKKSSKRGIRGKGKKYKGVTIYDSDSLDDDLPFTSDIDSDNTLASDVTIHFYDDILNPDSKRTFNSLYDFEEFLDSENIYVSSTDQASLLRNKINHCCKDPNFKSSNMPWLITDPTYGGLRWLCAANDEDIYYE